MNEEEDTEWDYDMFVGFLEQAVESVECLGRPMNQHHCGSEHTMGLYIEGIKRWSQITQGITAETLRSLQDRMSRLANEFGSVDERERFAR